VLRVAAMSPVVDCDAEEEIDFEELLLMPVSPSSSDDDVVDEVACPPPTPTAFTGISPSTPLRDLQPGDDSGTGLLLSGNCFADLDKLADDGDLTSLDWLQDINLLRNISPDGQQSSDPSLQKENMLVLPYHPKSNPCGKPPYSFSVLIFMAIESSPKRRLPVKGIYEWIANQFPFYKRAPSGWRNSVRHNLSLNRCFRKVEKVERVFICYNKCVLYQVLSSL